MPVLLIEVRWLDGRFHGEGDRGAEEWPPSPFRLFQALVAGAYGGRWAATPQPEADQAFAWLEGLPPPAIARPSAARTRGYSTFVPNNDLDAVGGDPARTGEIRVPKSIRPMLFDVEQSVLYAWSFDQGAEQAERLCGLAERLHTLGRGVDQAFARAEVVDAAEAARRLEAHGGGLGRPALGGVGGTPRPCPAPGSLHSLKLRHRALFGRFERVRDGRSHLTLFRQPPKAQSRTVAYEAQPVRLHFELRRSSDGAFGPAAQARAAAVVKAARSLVHDRLAEALPDQAELVSRVVLGKGGAIDPALRLRFAALPSVGFRHTSPAIRGLLVEAPVDRPLAPADVAWALAGRGLPGFDTVDPDGVVHELVLARSADAAMAARYGAGLRNAGDKGCDLWRTVTPMVLPVVSGRGRRSGKARAQAEDEAALAVAQALRHAGLTTPVTEVRLQREPFHIRGLAADAFEADRFDPRALRHVSIHFAEPRSGLLLIGDGRFLGLGLFARADSLHR